MLFIQIWVKRSEKIIATETAVSGRRKFYYKIKHCCGLPVWFSGFFCKRRICFMHFTICMVIADGDFAEKVVAVVLPVKLPWWLRCNIPWAADLTRLTSRADDSRHPMFRHRSGRFYFSGNSLLLWGMSAAVFTVGEIFMRRASIC